jgi:hypothetical protein
LRVSVCGSSFAIPAITRAATGFWDMVEAKVWQVRIGNSDLVELGNKAVAWKFTDSEFPSE